MKVYSVIVCYWPDIQQLDQLCENLLGDGARILLVDNTDQPYLTAEQRPAGCQLITPGRNTGIAHAQNLGIAAAAAASADVIVFFDQDSTIEPGFLPLLVSPLNLSKPDIVSPLHLDAVSNVELPSVRVSRHGLPKRVYPGNPSSPYPVDVVIASGTAATRQVFELAGTFDEGLFIDFVDTEWCLRCRKREIPIRLVPSAVMHHRIGSHSVDLRITTVQVHSPIRCYYQLRNCFHLFRKDHIPFLFALRETVSVFLSRFLLLLFVDDRTSYAKAYWAGLRDGVKGIAGSRPA